MKYNIKYPNARPMQEVEATIMKAHKPDNCHWCGAMTDFIDMDFETYICSEECDEALADEFFRHAMKYHN